ncbi:SGNH/GDSL hydrolase family protein [Actinocrinis puniceicyclus]|uniref:SGNH/GDSL hydrolase family protein n=1 Tax=Actinocrinis puniceicyclus TaxID=977794 RepID=A0A8J7WJW5_9ACTN|nr:SGNH/GDSL hydrolase family protein [Actinocrinis puniceicyclus]MBS2963611.1 SGNH/GDSL hydrolase family protein [Actinocrinis puniceicyclus]
MRPRHTLVALTAATATAAAVLLTAAPANASSTNYVALGDSYASGLGAGSYLSDGSSCYRSTNAAAYLWKNANSPASFAFPACSGATTSDVLSTQIASINSGTNLVSLIIGGNDVGFSSTMENCVLWGTSTCVSDVNADEAKAESVLPGRYDNVLSAIKAKAPNARIVFMDYPDFYDLSVSFCVGLSSTSRAKIDEGINVLDSLVQQAASRNGVVYADVRPIFSGHELCDGSGWLHSVDWTNIGDSYHPTATGQADGYYPVLAAHS